MSNAASEKMVITRVSDTAYHKREYVVKAVPPKMLFRRKSVTPAISCPVAPRNNVQGTINDLSAAEAHPRSVRPRTRAATARPARPGGAGPAGLFRGGVC